MKYKIATVLSIAALIIPAGLALAKDGGRGVFGPSGAQIAEHVQNSLNVSLRGDSDDNSSTSVDREDNERSNATSTERNKRQRGEFEREKHATSTASTTRDHEGFGKGGIVGFFRWIFGLPATTTVGEIQAQLNSTTTASTTVSSSNGLGFWARLLGFLHLGKDN